MIWTSCLTHQIGSEDDILSKMVEKLPVLYVLCIISDSQANTHVCLLRHNTQRREVEEAHPLTPKMSR